MFLYQLEEHMRNAESLPPISGIYWCTRDVDFNSPVGNHHFVTFVYDSQEQAIRMARQCNIEYRSEANDRDLLVYFSTVGVWWHCEVTTTGPAEDGNVYIGLKEVNNSFDEWYVANVAQKKEMLATALAAITTGYIVQAAIERTDAVAPAAYSRVDRLYINR